ncbi:MAG: DNA polymerase III subunit gamma/tau [Desulfobacterales bacterium]|jgi:DNA polymerase-3 subunit gamma/tau|nr:DNA polymerase III subunit gamma/tau [Desulfobacterales bacterium]
MSYLVLARKYRPQTFEAVVHQEHVTQTLSNAISSGRVAHAILFSGPRGTGKTTIARILAKAMNCKAGPSPNPCNTCRSCVEITAGNSTDVFEIDGASNNSVDQVRELRDNIKYMPAHSPYKIYIIDEVHMLSTAAFNALLKTLEEPPAHVLFFFATTEPHKIPITILSRCQRHDLRRIDLQAVVTHLAKLCAAEAIAFPEESLWVIARESGGSMRDALSLLDQMISCADGPILHDHVLDLLGAVDTETLFKISAAALTQNVSELLNILDTAHGRGRDLKKLYSDLIGHFRNLLVIKVAKNAAALVSFSDQEIEMARRQIQVVTPAVLTQTLDLLMREEQAIRYAVQPRLALEMAFIRLGVLKPALPIEHLIEGLDALRKDFFVDSGNKMGVPPPSYDDVPNGFHGKSAALKEPSAPVYPQKIAETSAPKNKPVETGETAESLDRAWQDILSRISIDYPMLAPNLTLSAAKTLSKSTIEIEVSGSKFNLNMVQREKSRGALAQVCSDYFGRPLQVTIHSGAIEISDHREGKEEEQQRKNEALRHPLVQDVIEIFDGKVVDVKMS